MDIPIPQPRRKSIPKSLQSDSTEEEHGSGSPFFHSKTIQVVHTVEVHNSLGDTSTNIEDNFSKVSERRKKKLKRKGTYSVNKSHSQKSEETIKTIEHLDVQSLDGSPKKCNSGTETLSDESSSSHSRKGILAPLVGTEIKKKKKKPSGYATETLSDESESEIEKSIPALLVVQKEDDGKTAEEIEPPLENESSPLLPVEVLPQVTSKECPSEDKIDSLSLANTPPMPVPRKTLNKSPEHLIDENQSIAHGSPQSYCTSSSLDYKDIGSLPKQTARFRKQRKKKKLKDSSTKTNQDDKNKPELPSPTGSVSEKKIMQKVEKPGNFICLSIHYCEPLKIDFKTRPYVKITFMDVDGKLKVNSKGDVIGPLVTQPYDFTCKRSTVPTWNEDLIVLEPLELIVNASTILIIEILDEEKSKCIVWGFLKLVAANGASNTGKKLRLQLFKHGKPSRDTSLPQAYTWWKKGERKKYESTLFLTLTGIPESMIINNKVDYPPKSEIFDKLSNKSVEHLTENEDKDLEDVRWRRLPSLSCKLPNKFLARLPAGPDGSIAIAYSHSGLLLASANKVNIGVYTFRGRPYLSLQGHTGLIYSVKWSLNDKYLLSASADFSSCVWDISRKNSTPIQIVSHPSYVYCCAWLDNSTFVTGCFDSDIRLWKIDSSSVLQQISRHSGQINSLIAYDNHIVSGDSTGIVYMWLWNNEGNLELEKELVIREIKGKVINKLSLHPGKRRLLIHTRDSVLRMIDLATGSVLHWFEGLVNTKLREDSTFCGCGSLVLAWSEDSTLCVWDANTGVQVALYPGLASDFHPGALDFHPHDHMMAVSGHSSLAPTLSILAFDRKSDGREVSLVLNKNINPGLTNSDPKTPYSDQSSESTPKKKESLLKTLLGTRRKPKKDNSAVTSIENSFTDFTRLQGLSSQVELSYRAEKESRLNEIIKRMDKILTSVAHSDRSLYTS